MIYAVLISVYNRYNGISLKYGGCKYVSPSWDILHNSKSEEDYVQRFNSEILAHRDPKAFLRIETL